MKMKKILKDGSTVMFDLELYKKICDIRKTPMVVRWRLDQIPKHKMYDFLRKAYESSLIKEGTRFIPVNGVKTTCDEVWFEWAPGGWIIIGYMTESTTYPYSYEAIIKNVNSWSFGSEVTWVEKVEILEPVKNQYSTP